MMKTNISTITMGMLLAAGMSSCETKESNISVTHQGDTLTTIHIKNPTKYLLLPIENNSDEMKVLLNTGSKADTDMDIRLAVSNPDYYVPFALPEGAKEATVVIRNTDPEAVCWDLISLSDSFDSSNRDKFRPLYHHTPLYGWMNDANGLIYKDGEYHLYFQYNPYGTKWGNMHWGHSVSKDLVTWEHLDPAIERDTMGHIFSGSSVVDHNNSAGFGKDAMIAFYTSASDENGQIQCMAYSEDNGRTFTKYENNPILTPFDGLKDFRDPKVFWYAPDQKWVMIVSADVEMRFYSSDNLKDWEYMSGFGKGYGAEFSQFECPEMVELAVDGNPDNKKWALIVNINPGCLFGGSATEYFIGDFDGTNFICDNEPEVVKWLDWGKDHYATVCFNNTGDRVIGVPWMNNWQYANYVPVEQFRSANALPRELFLFTDSKGEIMMGSKPVDELKTLRKEELNIGQINLNGEYIVEKLFDNNQGAFELEMEIDPSDSKTLGFEMLNEAGEKVVIYFDMPSQRVVMDRSQSGIIEFGEKSEPHFIETHEMRKTNSVNYINDFALGTWAPIEKGKKQKLQVFVDKCSVELFLNDGKIAMTNLVFPNSPYNKIRFFNDGKKPASVNATAYKLSE